MEADRRKLSFSRKQRADFRGPYLSRFPSDAGAAKRGRSLVALRAPRTELSNNMNITRENIEAFAARWAGIWMSAKKGCEVNHLLSPVLYVPQ